MKAKNPDRRTFIAKSAAGALAMESIVSACGESPVDLPTPPPIGLSVNLRPVGEIHPGEIRFEGSPVEVTYTLEVAEGTADTIEWSAEIVGDVDTGLVQQLEGSGSSFTVTYDELGLLGTVSVTVTGEGKEVTLEHDTQVTDIDPERIAILMKRWGDTELPGDVQDHIGILYPQYGTARIALRFDGSRSHRPNGLMSWSPDGKHLAYSTRAFGSGDIWLYDVLTGTNRRLTDMGSVTNVAPSWNSDGTKLAFLTGVRAPPDTIGGSLYEEPAIVSDPIGREDLTRADLTFITDDADPTFHGACITWYDDDTFLIGGNPGILTSSPPFTTELRDHLRVAIVTGINSGNPERSYFGGRSLEEYSATLEEYLATTHAGTDVYDVGCGSDGVGISSDTTVVYMMYWQTTASSGWTVVEENIDTGSLHSIVRATDPRISRSGQLLVTTNSHPDRRVIAVADAGGTQDLSLNTYRVSRRTEEHFAGINSR